MTDRSDRQRQHDDDLRREEGKSLRQRLQMQANMDKKKREQKEEDGIIAATAKLALSTVTGHVAAQQVAVAVVEGGKAAQAARAATRASMLDYVPGGDYAKLATGQKLSRADSLAMLGQHGGREFAQENGLSTKPRKDRGAVFSAVVASAKKQKQEALAESISDEPARERGWANEERRKRQQQRQEQQAADGAGTKSGSDTQQDAMSHPSEKSAKIDQQPRQPGTQIEGPLHQKVSEQKLEKEKKPVKEGLLLPNGKRMTHEEYEEMRRREEERDPGPRLKPF